MTKVIWSVTNIPLTLLGMNPSPTSLRHEIRLAALICGIGLIWSAQTSITSYWGFRALELTFGPLEVCAVGVLLWLSAQWRLVRHKTAQVIVQSQ